MIQILQFKLLLQAEENGEQVIRVIEEGTIVVTSTYV